MASYRFRPMTEDDLPLVRRWLLEPHVRRWWDEDDSPAYPDDDIEKRRRAISGADPTDHFVVERDGRPIGDIQSYRVDADPEWAAVIGIAEPSVGVDVFIGEPDLIGHGIGPDLLRTFLRDVVPRYEVDLVLIDPARSNTSAIRAYEKAGFRYLKMVDEPGTREPAHCLMELRRSTWSVQ